MGFGLKGSGFRVEDLIGIYGSRNRGTPIETPRYYSPYYKDTQKLQLFSKKKTYKGIWCLLRDVAGFEFSESA